MKNFKVLTVAQQVPRPGVWVSKWYYLCLDKHVIHKLIHTGQTLTLN